LRAIGSEEEEGVCLAEEEKDEEGEEVDFGCAGGFAGGLVGPQKRSNNRLERIRLGGRTDEAEPEIAWTALALALLALLAAVVVVAVLASLHA